MKESVLRLLQKNVPELSKSEIESLIEKPKDSSLGDYAFPCFSLAKSRKENPVAIAKSLELSISKTVSKEIQKVSAVGPYLNFFVNIPEYAGTVLKEILSKKEKYGSSKVPLGKTMIEFSQANTHKAFHIGHVRNTSIGESISRILEFCGNKVVRVNYQGDSGMHVAKWIWCYTKYHSKEKLNTEEKWIASIYVEAVKKLAENPELEMEVIEINKKLDDRSDKKLLDIWKKTRALSLEAFEPIYKELETRFDNYFFESELEQESKSVAKELVEKKIAKISEGATIIDFSDHGKKELGIWVLLRADGTPLYSIKDIALAKRKFTKYKIESAIYVVASEQQLHLKQLFETLRLMKFKQANKCVHKSYNLVRLPTGKMSSRTGDNVLYSSFKKELEDLAKKEIEKRDSEKDIEKRASHIALSALKYVMLKQDLNKVIVFDKNEAVRFEGDTGPYLLYTYARAASIVRKSRSKPSTTINSLEPAEKELVKKLSDFPGAVSHACKELDPSTLAHYAYTLAQTFNEFYHSNPVIGSDAESNRIALVSATMYVLKTTLSLLGISTIEKM